MKRQRIIYGLFLLCFLLSPVFLSCDTKETIHPYVVLNVNISAPVDAQHKLYVLFYLSPAPPWNYNKPLATLSYSEKTIIIPPLNTGQYPLFFEIIYDADGSATLTTTFTTGDWYQGWYRKIDRNADILSPIIMPSVEVMLLNVDLDTHGSIL
jgi:hypothetical protein